jgi:hypothetical protein
MAFDGATGFAADLQFRRRSPWRSLGWIAARFTWVVLTLLVMASPRVAVRAEAEVVDANKVPIEIIRFERGASGKDISGAVIRGERSLYSIDARSGQRLSVSISAEEDNAVFQIYAPGARAERRDYGVEIVGAKALPGAGEGEDAKTWSGVLPETGTYLVAVGPTRGNATYTLKVAIH